MIILRFFAGCMAWLTVLAINVLSITIALMCFFKSGHIGTALAVGSYAFDVPVPAAETNQKVWFVGGCVFGVVAILVVLITLLMIRRIAVAVACIKVGLGAI